MATEHIGQQSLGSPPHQVRGWLLMGLLFVGGVMNLLWIAVIAGFVLAEKLMPHGRMAGRLTGGVMILVGVGLLATWLG